MNNVLVIGGSGMLVGACREFSQQADNLVVVARNQDRLERLRDGLSSTCSYFPVSADWHDPEYLKQELDKLVFEFDLVVAWIHDDAKEAHSVVAGYCKHGADYFDITSHSGTKATHVSHQRKKDILGLGRDIKYHKVVLGSVNGRWLTNDEISTGVVEAVSVGSEEYIVDSL